MTTTINETTVEAVPVIGFPLDTFRDMVTAAVVAAGKDDTLPALTGVRVEWDGEGVRMVATDRYRLVRADWDCPGNSFGEGAVLVPAKELAGFVKALPKPKRGQSSPVVTFTVHGDTVSLSCTSPDGEVARTIRLLAGDFPKWRAVVPTEFTDLPSDGIGVNPAFMADVAKMPGERNAPVRARFTGAGRPIVFDPVRAVPSGVRWLFLLMPVRIGDR